MNAEGPTGGGGREISSRATSRLTRSGAGVAVASITQVVIVIVLDVIIEVAIQVFGITEVAVGRRAEGFLDDATLAEIGVVGHVVTMLLYRTLDNGLPGSAGSRRATTSARFHSTRLQRRRYAFKLVGRIVEPERQDDVVRERLVLGDGVARQRRVDARSHGRELLRVSTLADEELREPRCDGPVWRRTSGT